MGISIKQLEDELKQTTFLKDEVQFNLMYRIIEAKEFWAVADTEGTLIAAQNPGFKMWLWLYPGLEKTQTEEKLRALAAYTKELKIPGVAARPVIAAQFGEIYSEVTGQSHRLEMSMESYACCQVIGPSDPVGEVRPAKEKDISILAEFCAGFLKDAFHVNASAKSQMETAEKLLVSGSPYLLEVLGQAVCMANVAHRSLRHARINQVYTSPHERKKGYAANLVAALSRKVLQEGLTPMLYADVSNPASNKVYQNIGYEPAGIIDEIIFE